MQPSDPVSRLVPNTVGGTVSVERGRCPQLQGTRNPESPG